MLVFNGGWSVVGFKVGQRQVPFRRGLSSGRDTGGSVGKGEGIETKEETEVKTDFEKDSEVKTDWKYKLSIDDVLIGLREKGYDLGGGYACELSRTKETAQHRLDIGSWWVWHKSRTRILTVQWSVHF